jgi:phosphoglycerol transferase MdoB-like AlkP superfamily enzyme
MRFFHQAIFKKFYPVWVIFILVAVISILTRTVLLIGSSRDIDFNIVNIAGIYLIGLFYDLCFAAYLSLPVLLWSWLYTDKIYRKPFYWIVFTLFAALLAAIIFFNLVPKELNEALPIIAGSFVSILLIQFLWLVLKNTSYRLAWRTGGLQVFFFVLIFLLLFNAISEYFFWQEFGTRYNFIAVDYLIYTREVAGNIRQSYPVLWIVLAVALLSFFTWRLIRRKLKESVYASASFGKRTTWTICLLILPGLAYFFVTNRFRNFSNNSFVNELAGNGAYEFGAAYLNNSLDYYKFYPTIQDSVAFRELKNQLRERSPGDQFVYPDSLSVERDVRYDQPANKMNVVMISVESLSASFMEYFGNKSNITPQLDSLSKQSLFFTNFYASGTRTVRGMEALSLAIPPVPGQSILRRQNNQDLFSLGYVLRSQGYTTQFFYGGYSSFDNMGPFFKGNGYEVLDRSDLAPGEIHYANIWGVADEDMFDYSLKKMDEDAAKQKPFFAHIMTVSNHRPYTYPEGRIDISPKKQIRDGAVKYTDYAIGKFIRDARSKSWFNNTLFIIVADHCAYAAGKASLPVTGYHIPLLIYSPSHIQPVIDSALASQVDLAPTILGLLHISYRSKFIGQDIFRIPPGSERVFISTYQGLGYLRNGQLVVLQPPRHAEAYSPDFTNGTSQKIPVNDSLLRQAISYYQLAEKIFRSGGYKSN